MNKVVILFFIVLSQVSWAGEGSFVGNGTGYTEILFNEEYNNIQKCIKSLTAYEKAKFEDKEVDSLKKISNHQFATEKHFIFKDNKSGEFVFDGEEKVAYTYLTNKEPIYINTDIALYSFGGVRLEKKEIISIISHEVGHQVGVEDHAYLSTLGSKIASLCSGRTFKDKRVFYSTTSNEPVYIHSIYNLLMGSARDLKDFNILVPSQGKVISLRNKLHSLLKSCPPKMVKGISNVDITLNFSEVERNPFKNNEYSYLLSVQKSCLDVEFKDFIYPKMQRVEVFELKLKIDEELRHLNLKRATIKKWKN